MKKGLWIPIVTFLAFTGGTAACAFSGAKSEGSGGNTGAGTGGGGGFTASGAGTGGAATGGQGQSYGTSSASSGNMGGMGGAGGGTTTTTPTGVAGAGGMMVMCQPDQGTPQVFYMSADDSASMGSAAIAREFLNLTPPQAPPPALIRIYEFLNYYRVRYPVPADKQLAVHAHLAPAADKGKYRLQIGVQAFDVTRPTMALTFVVDTSGSLVGEGMKREKAAIRALAKQLHQGDHVNFVTWSTKESELLADHVITGPDDTAVLAAVDQLAPAGGSDLHSGLQHGYDLAAKSAAEDRLSRVVLISDGGANLGDTDRTTIEAQAKQGNDQGIYLVGVGLGPAQGYSDALMNAVTDAGSGAYVYLDSVEEADKVLGGRFDEVMDIAARNVGIKVTLPSYFHIDQFYGETIDTQESRVPRQHLAPADSMILSQVVSTCLNCLCGVDSITVETKWTSPFLHPAGNNPDVVQSVPFQISQIEETPPSYALLKAEAIVAYAKALQSQVGADFDLAKLALDAATKHPDMANDPYKEDLTEISGLLAKFPVTAVKPSGQ
jgi:Ca-activated chloride channel family protein